MFTPECIIMYLRVFNFLWRAKRMEYCLTLIWRNQMSNARALHSIPGKLFTLSFIIIHYHSHQMSNARDLHSIPGQHFTLSFIIIHYHSHQMSNARALHSIPGQLFTLSFIIIHYHSLSFTPDVQRQGSALDSR